MRTTLTLDPDVAVMLKRLQARRGQSLKKLVNDALREGLLRMTAPRVSGTSYRTPSVDLGRCLVGSLDHIAGALAIGEGEAYR
jgi:hypothetical protein